MEMRDDIDESDKVIERRHRNKRAVKQVEFEERDDCGYVPKRRAHIHRDVPVQQLGESAADGVNAAELFRLVSTPRIVRFQGRGRCRCRRYGSHCAFKKGGQ